MEKREYKRNAYGMIYLTAYALKGKIPKAKKIQQYDLKDLFEVCKKHSLTACVAYALESAGIKDNDFIQAKAKAIRKNVLLDVERKIILDKLEDEHIWYMPLKGSILKDIYPMLGMRQMADNDILCDSTKMADVRDIFISEGYICEHFGQRNHDIYFKEPVLNFEIHSSLFPPLHIGNLYEYFKDVKPKLIKDDGNEFGYHFSDEDFYVFMVAHEYKHFSGGGTGVRSLVDTYIFLRKFEQTLDWDYIDTELEKLDIVSYEKKNRELAMKVFSGIRLTEDEKELLDYYIFSGTYGNVEHSVNNKLKEYGTGAFAKFRYMLGRLFVPVSENDPRYAGYLSYYSWFYEKKYRLPLLFFYRLWLGVTKSRKRSVNEIRILIKKR